ncbi:MAG: ribonuclease HII [Candidatus Nanoarchaeia archaeon]
MKYFVGIDEAGRGPTLGPLVLAASLCTKEDKDFFKAQGVTDSKLLSLTKRDALKKLIQEKTQYAITKASPEKIDKALINPSSSLTYLEADMTVTLLKKFLKIISQKEHKDVHVMIDLPSKNKESYLSYIKTKLQNNKVIINAEFKADLHHVEVGAASILAKTTRDAAIRQAEKKLKIAIGSGYPSDPYTKKALEQHLKVLEDAKLVRTTWQTIKNLKNKKSQKLLDSF